MKYISDKCKEDTGLSIDAKVLPKSDNVQEYHKGLERTQAIEWEEEDNNVIASDILKNESNKRLSMVGTSIPPRGNFSMFCILFNYKMKFYLQILNVFE